LNGDSTADSATVSVAAAQQGPAVLVDQGTIKWLAVLAISCMRASRSCSKLCLSNLLVVCPTISVIPPMSTIP
jgi:hypothetical protein